jgi:hypothetical protein
MHPRIAAVAVCCVLFCARAWGQVREPLKPIEFLVGSCWTGSFANGNTNTHCFESMFDGKFIRDRHEVNGANGGKKLYGGESVYAWEPVRKKLVYTYWASDGGMSSGELQPGGDGELVFHDSYVSETGALTLKVVWTRRGPDAYEVWAARKAGDLWQDMWRMTMHRDSQAAKQRD